MLGKDVSLAEQQAKKEKRQKKLSKAEVNTSINDDINAYQNHLPENPPHLKHASTPFSDQQPSFGEFENKRSKSYKDVSPPKKSKETERAMNSSLPRSNKNES
jgi:hypothetical protein